MDSHEPMVPGMSNEDERGEQLNQPLSRRWGRSSPGKFMYSREKVDKVDIRSLDRVWERLEEHVTRNSAAYENNKNLPTFQQNNTEPVVEKDWPALTPHKQQAFQQRLGTLVAVFLLTMLIGSLVLVLQAMQHANTTTGAHGNIQGTSSPSKEATPGKQTVSITEKTGASSFTATKLVVVVGEGIIWHNQTGVEQVILTDRKNQTVNIAANALVVVVFNQVGVCAWHLQSNPDTQITIFVGNVPKQTSATGQCDFRVTYPPS